MDLLTENRRHSASHVLAAAVNRLFPNVRLGIGPVTNEGYYYDFEFAQPITWDDVKRIEEEMNVIIQEDLPFTQLFVPYAQAFEILLSRGQIYKAELLQALSDTEISFFKTGEEFVDLCRGPHVASTNEVGVVKLTALTESNWQNDPKRPKMQRIAGLAFATLEELNAYLAKQATLQKLDFRQLAADLRLTLGDFSNVVYSPKGTLVVNQIKNMILDTFKACNYQELNTSPIEKISDLEIAPDTFFKNKNRSYKELPLHFLTQGRHELTVPFQVQDKEIKSINTICYKSYFQTASAKDEINTVIAAVKQVISIFAPNLQVEITTANLELQVLAEIAEILQQIDVPQVQQINPKAVGVVLRFLVKDQFERQWPLATVTIVDTDLTYISRDGELTGLPTISMTWVVETILAYLLEDRDGALPFNLAPTQVLIIPITEKQQPYSLQIKELLAANNLRTEIDLRSETMQYKIRDAELMRAPIIIVIGAKEANNQSVSLRIHNHKELGMVSENELLATITGLNLS